MGGKSIFECFSPLDNQNGIYSIYNVSDVLIDKEPYDVWITLIKVPEKMIVIDNTYMIIASASNGIWVKTWTTLIKKIK